jgi:bifunctional non-homologous end joining protein LigD
MLWDRGTWELLGDASVEKQVERGDLKFRLHGEKLKGEFAIVLMKGRGKGNEWLLIKKHDEFVVEGYDIDKFDTSVLSGKTMAQIAGAEDAAKWKSSKPASGKVKAPWLAETLAKLDKKKAKTKSTTADAKEPKVKKN